MKTKFLKDVQFTKFSLYGFLKNLRFFDPYLLLFFLESGLDYFHIGILFSIREIATNVLEVPSGFAADLFGRRRAMMSAFGMYILSFLLFYYSAEFVLFAVAMLLFAGGEAFRTGTHKAMILDYLKRNDMEDWKVHYYGGTRAWSQLGSALSALIAGALVFIAGSYRPVFLYTLIPYFFGLFLMKSYPRYLDFSVENDRSNQSIETGSKKSGGSASGRVSAGREAGGTGGEGESSAGQKAGDIGGEGAAKGNAIRELLAGVLKTLREPVAGRGFLHASFTSAVYKTVKDYIQPMIRNIAVSLPLFAGLAETKRVSLLAGVVYFGIYILTAAASARAGRIEEKFSSRRRALNVTYLLLVVMLSAVAFFVGTPVVAVGVLVFVGLYIMENVRRPMTVGYLSSVIEGRSMATGLSVESQLKTVIVAVLAPAFGFIADGFGLSAAMASLAILTLIIYPFLRIVPSSEREKS